ncbi:unannotated protein [freshwater metagenome]|uniref:Unannotated protein n=1 Tax=freshwater metagenome TaxID=449393 RepID=A0A6J6E5W3_9ZZZZ|nr:DUF305 domain-containing protein [Actinomycetota bacterium]MSZ14046.1 DUF305 domain-containing protein [Actinomycetota bacterium]MTA18187.1 DUF305 domain-containing protein [Actinomycetota bacterium]MTA88357.1 DUF305 domain-containing protein [Actinomycetota bacterium]MTB02186.1 DUF305 domain-containing protein [Actinomycetota bacterium]
MNYRRVLSLVTATLAAAALVAACSSGESHSSMSDTSKQTIPESANFNATDVGFAQGMIPHHAQAVEMADLALEKSTNADVLALAKQIKASQNPEIQTMSGWLQSWGQKVPSTDSMSGGGHDMTDMGGMMMDGMMTEADMEKLESSSGTAFDRLWMELMIQHHEGAVRMSEDELKDGKNLDVKALAQTIVTSQQAEISTMNSLLSKLPS